MPKRKPTLHTCLLCHYTWWGKAKRLEAGRVIPKMCPDCKSRQWNEPPAQDATAPRA